MLLSMVIAYLFVTIAIGLWAARRVKNTADFAIAGRHLPMYMIITTTFATWFGSEIVLGVPAKFIEGGLRGVVEDPFGAGMCLILVGLFFAGKLYRMTLLTISDYYRHRYGRSIEIVCSLIIMLSYLGWVSAQVTALGLVFNLLSGGTVSIPVGMAIGVVSILAYTLFGGMWSVAVTDFLQMIILVVGLVVLAWFAGDMAGGADKVIDLAVSRDLFQFWPEPSWHDILFFFGAAITMMLGSIPQQDVFQRVMSAIKSCASATLLAPSVTFTENIWRQFRTQASDREMLLAMRISVLVFSICVLAYSIKMEGTPIYELVSSAYQVPLVGAFVPLVFGLYWKRATTQGAICAVALGIGVWVVFMATPALHEAFPQQLAGLLAAVTGMLAGSLAPQWLANRSADILEFRPER